MDPAVLADIPGRRYLTLAADHWNTRLDGPGAPPGLAAAHPAGEDAAIDDALARAARLGLDTEGALRLAGCVGG